MDAEWVEHIIKDYSPRLLHYLMNHTHSREDAEDMMQEIFVSVYEHCSEFDPSRCNEEAWLYIIAKRKIVSYYRKFKQLESIDEMEDFQLPGDNSMAQATNLMACRQAVAKALTSLDDRSRDVVVLKYFHDLGYKEIGQKLGISEGNARVICSRALEKMQDLLVDFEFSEE